MNSRILEILQNPTLLKLSDIEILEQEISRVPFVQSLRAVQLLAIHRFQQEQYPLKLSETAAFTTDKKILYHLIHQKTAAENNLETHVSKPSLVEKIKEPQSKTIPEEKFQKIKEEPEDAPKAVFINGELNRILFEGEEDFLEEAPVALDLETSEEAGKFVLMSDSKLNLKEKTEVSTSVELVEDKVETRENTAAKEDNIENLENSAQLSFHAGQDFLPEIKMEFKKEETAQVRINDKSKKQEEEIQSLVAAVEAKMKAKMREIPQKIEEDEPHSGIDFSENTKDLNQNSSVQTKENPEWKPMDFNQTKTSTPKNFSTQNQQKIEEITTSEENCTSAEIVENTDISTESNVPGFINTWQNWLKLAPKEEVKTENLKQKAIETFIEKEPKISKLKEESSFVVKDKGDNISHLMTETLANLYLDQKLYTKAQKAFELLIEKEPTKTEKFQKKLQEIQQMRSQK